MQFMQRKQHGSLAASAMKSEEEANSSCSSPVPGPVYMMSRLAVDAGLDLLQKKTPPPSVKQEVLG